MSTINVEAGHPSAQQAITKLKNEILNARYTGVRLLKIIHGWGSSGIGGVIRTECRKYLNGELAAKRIKNIVYGDVYSRDTEQGRLLLARFTTLQSSEVSDRTNPGITFVEL